MLEAAVLHTIFCPYRYWLQTDRKITRRVHELIKDTMRSPFEGIGKPKPLRHALIQILSGECEFSLAGKPHALKSGDFLQMPPNLPHAVKATKQFSMLLTLFKPA